MRATIDWSYELLTADEQRVFVALGVFPGSFGVDAVESVVGAELEIVAALVDKSLLRQTGEGRLFMLEMIRAYSLERLEEVGLASALRQRHADWVSALALTARDELRGPHRAEFLDRLTMEHANIRAALTFAITSEDAELALTIAGSLGRFWVFRGHEREGWAWLHAALNLPEPPHDEVRWRALYWGTVVADAQREKSAALALAEEALALAQELGNPEFVSGAALELVRRFLDAGDYERAKQLIHESIRVAADRGDDVGVEPFASVHAQILLYEGEPNAAAAELEESLTTARRSDDIHLVEAILGHLAIAQAVLGRRTECRTSLRESVNLLARLRFPYQLAISLQAAAQLALTEDEPSLAASFLVRADRLLDWANTVATGVEGALYDHTWGQVREHVSEPELEDLRRTLPPGDLDEALDHLSRYLG
ncbi:MAG: ATP-binding protein [Solirubrobacteraceae bacterium]